MPWYGATVRKLLLSKVLHAGDSPHAVAMGVAIATFVAFLPLMGIQTLLAVGLAAMARANKAVCVPIVWITNPLTAVPIYGACLAIGRFILSSPPETEPMALAGLGHGTETLHFFELRFWTNQLEALIGLGFELWVGCTILGVVFGAVSYGLARWGVVTYRKRREQRIRRRNLFRAQLQMKRSARLGKPA